MSPVLGTIIAAIIGSRVTANTAAGAGPFVFPANANATGGISFRPSPGRIAYGIQHVSGSNGHRNDFTMSSATNGGSLVHRITITSNGPGTPQRSVHIGTQNAAASTFFDIVVRRSNQHPGFRHSATVNGVAFRH